MLQQRLSFYFTTCRLGSHLPSVRAAAHTMPAPDVQSVYRPELAQLAGAHR